MAKVTDKVNGQGHIWNKYEKKSLLFCVMTIGPSIRKTWSIYYSTLKFQAQCHGRIQGKI